MASLRVRVPPALQAHLNLNLDSQMMQSVDYDDPDDLLLSRPKRRGFKWYPKRTFIIYLFGLLVFCIPVVLLIHAGLPSLDSIFNCGTTSETLATVTEEAAACMPNAEDESGGLAERFKKFQRGFPRLRGSSERGFPSVVEDDGIEFDWPSVKSMFAFYKLKEKGVGDGQRDTLRHMDHRLKDRAWVDWLWGLYKNTRTTKYWNLAREGATITYDIMKPGRAEWGTFGDQIKDFEELFGSAKKDGATWDPDTSVFLIYFGINDVSQLDRMKEGTWDIEATCQKLAKALFSVSQNLIDLGAKHLIYLNIHPFERSPKYMLPSGFTDIQPKVEKTVKWYNQYFHQEIATFRKTGGPGGKPINAIGFDLYGLISFMLEYPEYFGLTDGERYWINWEKQVEQGWEPEWGRMGLPFRDIQHLSWNVHQHIASSLNGLLLRHSSTFTKANLTENSIFAAVAPGSQP